MPNCLIASGSSDLILCFNLHYVKPLSAMDTRSSVKFSVEETSAAGMLRFVCNFSLFYVLVFVPFAVICLSCNAFDFYVLGCS